MKIVFLAPRFHTNQHYAVKALHNANHEVAFVAMYQGGSERHDILRPCVLGVAPSLLKKANAMSPAQGRAFLIRSGRPPLSKLWQALAHERPDVVVIRNPHLALGRAALGMTALLGAKPLLYTQSPLFVHRITLKHRLRGAAANIFRAPWITPVEHRGLVKPQKTIPNTHFVPFPIEYPPPRARSVHPTDERRLLSVGKFIPRKNHLLLLKLLAGARWRKQVTLTLVGEVSQPDHRAHLEQVRAAIRAADLTSQVSVRTNLSHSEMNLLYSTHDILVFPGVREPAAFCLLEAMSHGLRVVASSDNGTSNYIRKRGTIVDFEDHVAAEAAIERQLHENLSPHVEYGPSDYVHFLERALAT